MQNHGVRAYFLVAGILLVSTLCLTLAALPALATESNNAIMEILENANAEANNELRELRQEGVEIPQSADSLYSNALSEHEAAMQALDSGDTVSARTHATKALDLFKSLFDLLATLEQEVEEDDADLINEIDEDISNSQGWADNLRQLASANNITMISFSTYDSAINASIDALTEGNLKEAEEQFDLAQELLEDIHHDIQKSLEDNRERSEKAREFALETAERLGEIIADLEEDSPTPDDFQSEIIGKLESMMAQLENETDIEKIIEITDESSELQTVIDEYNAYRVENFEENGYYSDIQEDIAKLHAIASKLDITIQSSEIDGLLSSAREKAEAGQEDDAAEELDRLDSLLDEIEDIVQEFMSVTEEIGEIRTTALALRSEAVNNAKALEEIDKAISFLEEANSTVMVAAQVGIGFETIGDVYAQLQSASRLTHEAEDILEEFEGNFDNEEEDERSESIMKTISEYEDWANDLRAEALEADNNEAIQVIEEALSLIKQARNTALVGNLDRAESYLDSARIHLEDAEQILNIDNSHKEDSEDD